MLKISKSSVSKMRDYILCGLFFILSLISKPAESVFIVKDINPISGEDSSPANLFNHRGILYFAADDGTHGRELWRSDGTAAGTYLVKDIAPGAGDSNIQYFASLDRLLFFSANDGEHGQELWATDGTPDGTMLVKDIYPGTISSFPSYLKVARGILFFQADDGEHGKELWRSDGTGPGTILVKDIWQDPQSSNPAFLVEYKNLLYFSLANSAGRYELWKSDGTATGTEMVYIFADAPPSYLTVLKDALFFKASDGAHGVELWKTDGTPEGTLMVRDILEGALSSSPLSLTTCGNLLYMIAWKPATGYEPWRSDGTSEGTSMLGDIIPGDDGFSYRYPLNPGENLLYFAYSGALWRSDGTVQGTYTVINNFYGVSTTMLYLRGFLFFGAARTQQESYRLWQYNETTQSTTVIPDSNTTSQGPSPELFCVAGKYLFFNGYDWAIGEELMALKLSPAQYISVSEIVNHILGIEILPDYMIPLADVNSDGLISVADIAMLIILEGH